MIMWAWLFVFGLQRIYCQLYKTSLITYNDYFVLDLCTGVTNKVVYDKTQSITQLVLISDEVKQCREQIQIFYCFNNELVKINFEGGLRILNTKAWYIEVFFMNCSIVLEHLTLQFIQNDRKQANLKIQLINAQQLLIDDFKIRTFDANQSASQLVYIESAFNTTIINLELNIPSSFEIISEFLFIHNLTITQQSQTALALIVCSSNNIHLSNINILNSIHSHPNLIKVVQPQQAQKSNFSNITIINTTFLQSVQILLIDSSNRTGIQESLVEHFLIEDSNFTDLSIIINFSYDTLIVNDISIIRCNQTLISLFLSNPSVTKIVLIELKNIRILFSSQIYHAKFYLITIESPVDKLLVENFNSSQIYNLNTLFIEIKMVRQLRIVNFYIFNTTLTINILCSNLIIQLMKIASIRQNTTIMAASAIENISIVDVIFSKIEMDTQPIMNLISPQVKLRIFKIENITINQSIIIIDANENLELTNFGITYIKGHLFKIRGKHVTLKHLFCKHIQLIDQPLISISIFEKEQGNFTEIHHILVSNINFIYISNLLTFKVAKNQLLQISFTIGLAYLEIQKINIFNSNLSVVNSFIDIQLTAGLSLVKISKCQIFMQNRTSFIRLVTEEIVILFIQQIIINHKSNKLIEFNPKDQPTIQIVTSSSEYFTQSINRFRNLQQSVANIQDVLLYNVQFFYSVSGISVNQKNIHVKLYQYLDKFIDCKECINFRMVNTSISQLARQQDKNPSSIFTLDSISIIIDQLTLLMYKCSGCQDIIILNVFGKLSISKIFYSSLMRNLHLRIQGSVNSSAWLNRFQLISLSIYIENFQTVKIHMITIIPIISEDKHKKLPNINGILKLNVYKAKTLFMKNFIAKQLNQVSCLFEVENNTILGDLVVNGINQTAPFLNIKSNLMRISNLKVTNSIFSSTIMGLFQQFRILEIEKLLIDQCKFLNASLIFTQSQATALLQLTMMLLIHTEINNKIMNQQFIEFNSPIMKIETRNFLFNLSLIQWDQSSYVYLPLNSNRYNLDCKLKVAIMSSHISIVGGTFFQGIFSQRLQLQQILFFNCTHNVYQLFVLEQIQLVKIVFLKIIRSQILQENQVFSALIIKNLSKVSHSFVLHRLDGNSSKYIVISAFKKIYKHSSTEIIINSFISHITLDADTRYYLLNFSQTQTLFIERGRVNSGTPQIYFMIDSFIVLNLVDIQINCSMNHQIGLSFKTAIYQINSGRNLTVKNLFFLNPQLSLFSAQTLGYIKLFGLQVIHATSLILISTNSTLTLMIMRAIIFNVHPPDGLAKFALAIFQTETVILESIRLSNISNFCLAHITNSTITMVGSLLKNIDRCSQSLFNLEQIQLTFKQNIILVNSQSAQKNPFNPACLIILFNDQFKQINITYNIFSGIKSGISIYIQESFLQRLGLNHFREDACQSSVQYYPTRLQYIMLSTDNLTNQNKPTTIFDYPIIKPQLNNFSCLLGESFRIKLVPQHLDACQKAKQNSKTTLQATVSFQSKTENFDKKLMSSSWMMNSQNSQTIPRLDINLTLQMKQWYAYNDTYVYGILVIFLPCPIGFHLPNEKECTICPSMTYNYGINSYLCLRCPAVAICKGGIISDLFQGYWRLNNISDAIEECINMQRNCLENNLCLQGTFGPLCETCDSFAQFWPDQYYPEDVYKCTICDISASSLSIMIVAKLGLVGYLFLLLYINRKGILDGLTIKYIGYMGMLTFGSSGLLQIDSIYLKILTVHLQILYVLKDFRIIDDSVPLISKSLSFPSKSTDYTQNLLECLYIRIMEDPNLVSFVRLGMNMISLVAVKIGLILIYLLFVKCKFSSIKKETLVFSLVFLYLYFQPRIIQDLVQSLTCRTIGSQEYQSDNLLVSCHNELFLKLNGFITIPLIIVVGLLLPLLMIFRVKRNQQQLGRIYLPSKAIKYGVLIQDYNHNHKLFEFNFMSRKLFLLVVAVQNTKFPEVKLSAMLLIMIAYKWGLQNYSPFLTLKVDKFHTMSEYLIMVSITIYIIVIQKVSQSVNLTLLIILISLNLLLCLGLVFLVLQINILRGLKLLNTQGFRGINKGLLLWKNLGNLWSSRLTKYSTKPPSPPADLELDFEQFDYFF